MDLQKLYSTGFLSCLVQGTAKLGAVARWLRLFILAENKIAHNLSNTVHLLYY